MRNNFMWKAFLALVGGYDFNSLLGSGKLEKVYSHKVHARDDEFGLDGEQDFGNYCDVVCKRKRKKDEMTLVLNQMECARLLEIPKYVEKNYSRHELLVSQYILGPMSSFSDPYSTVSVLNGMSVVEGDNAFFNLCEWRSDGFGADTMVSVVRGEHEKKGVGGGAKDGRHWTRDNEVDLGSIMDADFCTRDVMVACVGGGDKVVEEGYAFSENLKRIWCRGSEGVVRKELRKIEKDNDEKEVLMEDSLFFDGYFDYKEDEVLRELGFYRTGLFGGRDNFVSGVEGNKGLNVRFSLKMFPTLVLSVECITGNLCNGLYFCPFLNHMIDEGDISRIQLGLRNLEKYQNRRSTVLFLSTTIMLSLCEIQYYCSNNDDEGEVVTSEYDSDIFLNRCFPLNPGGYHVIEKCIISPSDFDGLDPENASDFFYRTN